jgi:ATP-dependent Clp protease, protease subunit
MILRINGDIVGNDMKEIYNWFGLECTCPSDVLSAIETMPEGDRLQVKINSGGGDVLAGQEIYSVLRNRNDIDIEVESMAASAASIIAMAGHSTISPVGMVMIHNVLVCGASGNKHDMKKNAEILNAYDEALANAYVEKTGKPHDEILKMMDKETWLTADRAVELGFIDAISEAAPTLSNSIGGMKVTDDMIAQFNAHKAELERKAQLKSEILDGLDKFGAKEG